ncbi:MAG: DUF4387 domain-containing protein [Desulfurococcales archaeon]|nr:DUF4387 domain-containing protein [Desulfurococcales archaeon]
MAKLYDIARVVRSKNSGPFTLTLDLLFEDEDCWRQVSNKLTKEMVASAYKVKPEDVLDIIAYKPALAVKINMRRRIPSGHPGDMDVYGAQQHIPLALIELDIDCTGGKL